MTLVYVAGAVAGIVGTGLNVYGAKKAGDESEEAFRVRSAAARKQAESIKAISLYNARRLEVQASQTRRAGVEAENKVRRGTAELISSQRASYSAGGVIADTGTAASVQIDSARLGEVDALTTRRNYQDQASTLVHSSIATRMQGDADSQAALNEAGAFGDAASSAGRAGTFNAIAAGFNGFDSSWFNSDSSAGSPTPDASSQIANQNY